jgi:ATP-binding cassette subfamily F protein 3
MSQPTILDLEMREALTEALLGYGGALVVISHDRHLLRNTVDEFWHVHDGQVEVFDGTLDDYHQLSKAPLISRSLVLDSPAAALSGSTGVDKKSQRQQAAQVRQQLAPLKKQIEQLEKSISQQHLQLADIEKQLADPDVYQSDTKNILQKLLADQVSIRKAHDLNEEQWFALQELLEQKELELKGEL